MNHNPNSGINAVKYQKWYKIQPRSAHDKTWWT